MSFKNQKAFTMIELVFVIMIIGILAAIALPKLSATKGDAEAVQIANNLATCVGDAGGAYLKTSFFIGVSGGTVDTLPLGSVACTISRLSAKSGEACYSLSVSDAFGSMNIAETGTNDICVNAHKVSEKNGISVAGATQVLRF